jgi:membrane-associated phospholipid phosphatase
MLEIIQVLISADHSVFFFINKTLANPVTDFVMPLVTIDLHLKIFYAFCLAVILWKGDRRLRYAIIFSLITIAATDLITSAFLKHLFVRPRPCHTFDVHLLVPCGAGFSMPSSHAANLFGQAFLFRSIARKISWLLIPFAIIVALSRVFVGVHYPADILVGAALGTVIGFLIAKIFCRFFPEKIIPLREVDNAV